MEITTVGGRPENVVYASDYSTLADAVAASCDVDKALLLNKSFSVSAPVALTNDGSSIFGLGRGYNKSNLPIITATAACAVGVFDIRCDGFTLENFTIDVNSQAGSQGLKIGNIPGTDTGNARCGVIRNVEILNAAGAAVYFGNDVDYITMDRVRMMTGNAHCIQINTPAGSDYDNGHLYVYNSEMSATHTCLERIGTTATWHRVGFFGCDFHDGHSNDYMIDGSNIHDLRFHDCCFEATDGANNGPDTAMVHLNGYGQGLYGCEFSFKDNTAGYYGVLGDAAYDPYVLFGCTMENSVAAQHTEVVGSAATVVFAGLQSTYRYNCAGTASSNAADLYDLVD